MLEVADALAVVFRHARSLAPSPTAPAPGLVLAEDVASDLDMPPYDKAMMDGYAVRAADLADGPRELAVVEDLTAGRTPTKTVTAGQAVRIMTGAPVPRGADAVVMVERCESVGDGGVLVPAGVTAGQNIQPRAREMRRGERVLAAGTELRAQECGLLAIVGRTSVLAYPPPQVAVLSTGDELVGPNDVPGPGRIRNSNGPMLVAQVTAAGGGPRPLGIARDDEDDLHRLVGSGLESNVILLSGGVSAGKLDLVPGVLREAGVDAHFHKIRMKPGKPLLFGTREDTLVFGLPGNPVSSFVCFELFVRPALRVLRGLPAEPPPFVPLPLVEEFAYTTDRPTYHPARVESADVGEQVRPVPWHGSPDLRALTAANSLMLVSAGEHRYASGEPVPVLRLR